MSTTTHADPASDQAIDQAVTTRDLDPTLTSVDLNGRLLAFVYQDPDTTYWVIRDRRRLTRVELGDFATRPAAVAYVTSRARWFDTVPPPAEEVG